MQKSHKDKIILELWQVLNFIYKVILVLAVYMTLITLSFYIELLRVDDLNLIGVLKVDFFIFFIIIVRNYFFYKYIKKIEK